MGSDLRAKYISKPMSLSLLANLFFYFFLALRPKATAMVMARRSVHLTTLFPEQA